MKHGWTNDPQVYLEDKAYTDVGLDGIVHEDKEIDIGIQNTSNWWLS